MVACDDVVRGAWEYARVKINDCCASASKLGVSLRSEPRKPMRSARVVSSVIRIMFGFLAVAALSEVVRSTNSSRVKSIAQYD